MMYQPPPQGYYHMPPPPTHDMSGPPQVQGASHGQSYMSAAASMQPHPHFSPSGWGHHTPAAEGGSETKVVAPTLKEYSLENLNDFFLRYEAYAADKTVKKPAHWFKLIDAPLRAALLDVTGTKKVSTDEEAKKFKKDLFSLDAPATSYDLHTELFTVVMEKSLSVTAFIKYVTNFKRIVSQAPDLGVDST
ncbi:hypothetical protein ADUPG1_007267, partial [Aduncisulcus paluster]